MGDHWFSHDKNTKLSCATSNREFFDPYDTHVAKTNRNLCPENDSPKQAFSSKWYHAIEEIVSRLQAIPLPDITKPVSQMLYNEFDFLRLSKKFAEEAKKNVVFLVHCLSADTLKKKEDLLNQLGFQHITHSTFPNVSPFFKPLFNRDIVYVRNGIVFTIINGGFPQDDYTFISNDSKLDFSVFQAEKIYGMLQKSNSAFLSFLVRSILSPQESSEGSMDCRFFLPMSAMIEYNMIRVVAEPFLPIIPRPVDLCIFRANDHNPDDSNLRKKVLKDPCLHIQLKSMNSFLGTQTPTFPCLVSEEIDKDNYKEIIAKFGVVNCLFQPQFLYCVPFKKIVVRRALTFLPLQLFKVYKNVEELWNVDIISDLVRNRIRPELLYYLNHSCNNVKPSKLDPVLCWYGKLKTIEEYSDYQNDLYKQQVLHKSSTLCEFSRPFTDLVEEESNLADTYDISKLLLPIFIAQVKETLITLRDSGDISRAFHCLGIPLRMLLMVYTHASLPACFKEIISIELIARAARHWFVLAIRRKQSGDSAINTVPSVNVSKDLNQLVAKLFMSLSNASDFNSVAIYPFIVKSSGRSYLNEVDHFVPVPMHPQLLKNALETHFGILINSKVLDKNFWLNNFAPISILDQTIGVGILVMDKFIEEFTEIIESQNSEKYYLAKEVLIPAFHPLLRLVSPEPSLPAMQAAEMVIRDYMNNFEQQSVMDVDLSYNTTEDGNQQSRNTDYTGRFSDFYIPLKFNMNMISNMTTFGLIKKIKCFVYNKTLPCSPECIRMEMSDEMIDLHTVGLMSQEISKNFTWCFNTSNLFKKPLCKQFLELWIAIHIVLLGREAVGEEWVYCNGTTHEQKNFKLLLALGYIYFQHQYLNEAILIAKQVLQLAKKNSIAYLNAQELLIQCELCTENLCTAENRLNYVVSKIRKGSGNSEVFSGTYMIYIFFLYLALTIRASELQDAGKMYIFASRAKRLCRWLFDKEPWHWCSISCQYLLVCASLDTKRFLEAERNALDVLERIKLFPFSSPYLKGLILYILSEVLYRTKRWKECAQISMDAVTVLSHHFNSLLPLKISCVYQIAQALQNWGIEEIQSAHLRSTILIKSDINAKDNQETKYYPCFKPEFFAEDQTTLVHIFNVKDREKARVKSQAYYDSLFRYIVCKLKQVNVKAIFVEREKRLSDYPTVFNAHVSMMKNTHLMKESSWESNISRLMNILKNVIQLRFISLTWVEQDMFVKHILNNFKKVSYDVAEEASEVCTDSLDTLWKTNNAINTLAVVTPIMDGGPNLQDEITFTNFLFNPWKPQLANALLFLVLQQCCYIPSSPQGSEVNLIQTPNEWFTKAFEIAMNEITPLNIHMCRTVLFLCRVCCPEFLKKILIFHMGIQGPSFWSRVNSSLVLN